LSANVATADRSPTLNRIRRIRLPCGSTSLGACADEICSGVAVVPGVREPPAVVALDVVALDVGAAVAGSGSGVLHAAANAMTIPLVSSPPRPGRSRRVRLLLPVLVMVVFIVVVPFEFSGLTLFGALVGWLRPSGRGSGWIRAG